MTDDEAVDMVLEHCGYSSSADDHCDSRRVNPSDGAAEMLVSLLMLINVYC